MSAQPPGLPLWQLLALLLIIESGLEQLIPFLGGNSSLDEFPIIGGKIRERILKISPEAVIEIQLILSAIDLPSVNYARRHRSTTNLH